MKIFIKREKGVSEVIGTLLILTITVVLFSSVFYYVATMPPPQSRVYASFQASYFIDNEGFANITIKNVGGESLNAASTNIIFVFTNNTGTFTAIHPLTDFVLQLKSTTWNVGSSIVYNSSIDKVHVTYLSGITLYIIDKNSNSLVWQEVLSGQLPGLYISGLSYSPNPIPSGTSYLTTFTAYVIYNLNTNQIPKVYLDLSSVKGSNVTMNYVSPLTFQIVTQVGPVNPGVYNIKIYAKTNTSSASRVFQLNFQLTSSSYGLTITSVSLDNLEPLHLSNDQIFVSIYNPSPKAESFQLIYTDTYKGTSININTSTGNPSPTLTIQPFTTLTVTTTWLNVGGSGPASGVHVLYVNFTNVTPFVPSKGGNISLTVLPKILLIDDEGISPNSPKSVLNFYTNMFLYTSYSVDLQVLSPNQLASIAGYDLLIWITGYTGVIGSGQSAQILNFINNGGSVLLISNNSYSYSYLGVNANKISPTNNNIEYGNYINPSLLVNITCNVNYPSGNINAVTFSGNGIKALANFIGISSPSVVYGTTSKGGRFTYIGYEFSSMYVYQQDYVMNKIIMWLSNIGIRYGNDLALADLKINPTSPYFMQNVTLSFIIINYSPKALTDVSLEVLIDNAPIGGQPIYTINYINGNGTFIIFNVTWQATTPGVHRIYAYVNPFHTIPEVNYNNNALSSLVNTSLFVKYSTLVIWVHRNSDKNYNITSVTNTLKNLGVSYKFLEYNEGSNTNPPNINSPSSPYFFLKYNLIIVDFNKTGDLSSTWGNVLAKAIYTYLNNKNATKYPYSLLILGENAGNAIESNSTIQGILKITSINVLNINPPNNKGYLYGLVYNGVNTNTGPLGQNLSRGYGLYYQYYNYLTIINLNPNVYGTAIFDVYNYAPSSKPNYTGNAVIENISNVIVTIFPYSIENIIGFIQNHTISYSPQSTSSNPLFMTLPNSVQYARNFLMMNFLVASRYMFNNALPEITSPDISINSNVVTLNNYYLITVTIRNLGTIPTYITLKAFEETSMFYSSQPIYLVGSTMNSITTVTATIIWKPTYASSPNPEWLRFVLVPSSGQIPILPMQEALITQKVYFFYDNLTNGGTNWNHYATVFGYEGTLYNDQTSEINDNGWYSSEPYSEFGSVTPEDLINSINQLTLFQTYIYDASGVYDSSNQYGWNFYENGLSGGYSIGISWNINSYYDYWTGTYTWTQSDYILETNAININGASSAYLEFYANYQLAFGAEGVVVFISQDEGNWYYIQPMQGYPANVEFIVPSGSGNFNYPINGGLTPAFNTLSGGWTFYKFDLCHTWYGINASQWNKLYIMFVFSYASDREANTFGNDGFYIDDIKVIETGSLTQQPSTINGGSIGDTWSLSTYNGQQVFSNSLSYYEIDNLVSIPISLTNAIYANFNFQTNYMIWSRWSLANIIEDVPNGFRVYIGVMSTNGGIKWNQLDTRWAGESGITPPGLNWASNIPSNFYTGIGAFSPTTGSQINITQFAGQTIYIKFEVNGDYPTEYYYNTGFEGTYGLITATSSNYVLLTNIIIQGYSLYSPIQVQSVWT
ncbi:MAG: type IV pilin [Thermoplasmata archaeon]